jgi:hypothetical protein
MLNRGGVLHVGDADIFGVELNLNRLMPLLVLTPKGVPKLFPCTMPIFRMPKLGAARVLST